MIAKIALEPAYIYSHITNASVIVYKWRYMPKLSGKRRSLVLSQVALQLFRGGEVVRP